MRSVIIGDIHGCARTFSALLMEVRPDPSQDQLILLGDLFDRGPDAWQVYQHVQRLQSAFADRFILVRGNHEDYWLTEHPTLRERFLHERVGKRATVTSFAKHGEDMQACISWLRVQARGYYESRFFQCVHAGIREERPELNDDYTLRHDHDLIFHNSYAGKLTITGHVALDKPTWFTGDGATCIELDERSQNDLPPQGAICIDTGCGKDGTLTAMVIENGRYELLSVPQLDVL